MELPKCVWLLSYYNNNKVLLCLFVSLSWKQHNAAAIMQHGSYSDDLCLDQLKGQFTPKSKMDVVQ